MADIELVIRIPDEEYKKIQNSNPSYADDFSIYYAIKNGTPLPKGRGRMIILSEDSVKREQCAVSFSRQKWISEVGLSNATVAIIEADEAKSEVQE